MLFLDWRSTSDRSFGRRGDVPFPLSCVAPRKEVIQPHVPVRLPCYDFTPIIDPTLGACLPYGLARRV